MAVAEGEPHDKTFALHGQYTNGGYDQGDGDVFGWWNADGTLLVNIQQSSAASNVCQYIICDGVVYLSTIF